MAYIDGTIIPVPAARKDDYIALAKTMAAAFIEHGATQVVDAWPDDVPQGKLTDFHRSVAVEEGEVPVLGWIVWPSKAVRDAGWEKVMADPRMPKDMSAMPWDGKRMIFGAFDVVSQVDA